MDEIEQGAARPRQLRFSLPAALCVLWLVLPPASAAPASTGELDARIQSALDGIPAERVDEVVARIVETNVASTGYHAFSPGSFFQTGAPDMNLALDTAAGSLLFDDSFKNCMYAPLHLPQGSTITALVLWAVDDNTAQEADAALYRRRVDGATGIQEVALLSSSGATSGARVFTDFSILNGSVDNANYWYFAYVCLPGANQIGGPAEMRGLYVSYSY